MNGGLLLIPFFLVRFGLLVLRDKEAVRRAAYFAPLKGKEKIAYWVYQAANLGIFAGLFFLHIPIIMDGVFYLGTGCYFAGLMLCAVAVIHFADPSRDGLHTNGIYKFSRNPMYISYFVCFTGMALLTRSVLLFLFVLVFQISAHWIILSEERWCLETFGTEYKEYMRKVRRYL